MYRVGFGDCFLLSFSYAQPLPDDRRERHVLIDFGSTSLPAGGGLEKVGQLIRLHSAGQLDAVVVTHRHADHLSGFAPSAIADQLVVHDFPRLVVRSWTENPTAARDAYTAFDPAGAGNAFGPLSASFVTSLGASHGFATELHAKLAGADPGSLAGQVRHAAEEQLANASAVARLEAWSGTDRGEYLHYGMPTRLTDLLPGIGIRVLGPPTVDQHPAVARQRSRDPSEFWMIYRRQVLERLRSDDLLSAGQSSDEAAAGPPDQSPGLAADPAQDEAPMPSRPRGDPGPVRWLTDRMRRQQLNSLLRIVRILDAALNNTSVILLFELPTADGPLRLLFGGDAQIENWEYALKFAPDAAPNRELLRTVDLYKVGHHGSRNATPRTLFNLWNEPDTQDRPMTAVLSTKANVHGKSAATAVPRKTLVAALDTRMAGRFHTTQTLTSARPFFELEATLTNGRDLRPVDAE